MVVTGRNRGHHERKTTMTFSTSIKIVAASLASAVTLVAAAQAGQGGDAASYYSPRALKALGAQWEAKANFYGKHSVSLQKAKVGPTEAPKAAAECSFGPGECPAESPGPSRPAAGATASPAPASAECAWDEESGSGGC
jgi:hypothetical protein